MRFRFGLRALLTVPVLLAAALGWWVTWPLRTAAHFVHLMETDLEQATALSSQNNGGMANILRKYKHDPPFLEPQERTYSDVLRGMQTFVVVTPVEGVQLDGEDMEFTATLYFERGRLRGPLELDSRPRPSRVEVQPRE